MRNRTLSALFLIFLGSSALAQGTRYDCEMGQTRDGDGFIPEKMEILVQQDGSATVSGSLWQYYIRYGDAKVRRSTASKLVIGWTGHGLSNSKDAGLIRFNLTATIRNDGKITVHASPSGYRDRFFETGTCTKRPG